MARVIHLDTDEHQAVQALLPWYVNGTLEGVELARVQSHLAKCARCQADAVWENRVRPAAPPEGAASDAEVDRHWAALAHRLGLSAARTPPGRQDGAGSWLKARWLPLAIGLQAVIVMTLALAWWVVPQRDEAYRALGAAPAAVTANVLVVFRPTATETDIRRALRAHHAQLVGGPTATDAYLLHLSALSPEALSRLRADGTVLRVESLEGDGR
jgi:hypothetical protein